MKIKETKTTNTVDLGDIVRIQVDDSTVYYRIIVLLKEGYNMIDLDECRYAFCECYDTIGEMMLDMKSIWREFDVIKSENIELNING